MARSLGELAAQFGCELVGDPQVNVESVATLSNAGTSQLSFFANAAYRDQLQSTRAAAVLVQERDAGDCPVAALISDDPYLAYAQMAAVLHQNSSGTRRLQVTILLLGTAYCTQARRLILRKMF